MGQTATEQFKATLKELEGTRLALVEAETAAASAQAYLEDMQAAVQEGNAERRALQDRLTSTVEALTVLRGEHEAAKATMEANHAAAAEAKIAVANAEARAAARDETVAEAQQALRDLQKDYDLLKRDKTHTY